MNIYVKGLIEKAIQDTVTEELENQLTQRTLEQYLLTAGKAQGLRLAIEIIDRIYQEYQTT